ncbi:MAG: WD40/YVTN/BNR-like repeat-containing protein [Actinomycetota bacterium]
MDSVGRGLTLQAGGAHMLAETPPIAVARVFAIPGSVDDETWAMGNSMSMKPGSVDLANGEGQLVFMRKTSGTDWQYMGPPVDSTGAIDDQFISQFAMVRSGEGWAVGASGRMYHRLPGKNFVRLDTQPTNNDLNAISLGYDSSGVYGFAVGANQTILKLSNGTWSVDLPGPQTGSTNAIPTFVGVSSVSASEAWAVAQQAPNQLSLWHRSNGVWGRTTTGNPIFDSPPAPIVSAGGSTINQQTQASNVWASSNAVWVTGFIQPADATSTVNETSASQAPQRPFALHYDVASRTFTSYCTPLYQLSNGATLTAKICDDPFPFAVGGLPVLQGFSNGDALAAGNGFFGFSHVTGQWTRLPDVVNYTVSGSFSSPTEGWLCANGSNNNAVGSAASITLSLGHWTKSAPRSEPMKRWETMSRDMQESIAADPSDPSHAISVGANGSIIEVQPGVGPELMSSPTTNGLHGITWPQHDSAWAVGDNGTILHYSAGSWSEDPASGKLTSRTLFSVAFVNADRGYAVGAGPTILCFSKGAWHKDHVPQSVQYKLISVAAAGNDAIAVGDGGVLLKNSGKSWVLDDRVMKMVANPQDPNGEASLQSVAGLADGTAVVGGSRATVLIRRPGGQFEFSDLPPMYATIHSIALGYDSRGHFGVYVSVGYAQNYSSFSNLGISDPAGLLFAGFDGEWKALCPGNVAMSFDTNVDAPIRQDSVYGIAAGPNGSAWASGGFPALPDQQGHTPLAATSSLWRVDLGGHPDSSPQDAQATPNIPPGSVAFGFASDLGCATGLCGSSLGSGDRGQVMSIDAFDQMQSLADRGLLQFVALGGNLRRTGIPDELAQLNPLFDEMSVPVYAALGPQDLFGGISSQNVLPSPGYWESVFASRPAPWGSSAAPLGFAPVALPTDASPAVNQARTHYAFDYAPNGKHVLRMIFIDTSRTPLATSTQNPNESQTTWLTNVLANANTSGIPSVVVMSQPLVTGFSTNADAATITSQLTTGGVSGVISGSTHLNEEAFVGAAGVGFPAGTFGTTGGLLGGTWRPYRGAYASWQFVIVPAGVKPQVEIRSMPLFEGIALNAPEGRFQHSGGTLRFNALGRAPDAGSANAGGPGADGNEPYSTYVPIPFGRACAALENPDASGCVAPNVKTPDYSFQCEDQSVCEFVQEDSANPGIPKKDASGNLIPDSKSTMMCALNPGSTYVRIESGLAAARLPISVSGGSGPCVPKYVSQPLPSAQGTVIQAPPPSRPVTVNPKQPVDPQILKPKTFSVAALPALAPPPVQPAPAPPGGGAPKYEEEKEAASEKAEMTALDPHAIAVGARNNALAGAAEGLGIGAFGVAILLAAAIRLQPRIKPRPGRPFAWAGRRPRGGSGDSWLVPRSNKFKPPPPNRPR